MENFLESIINAELLMRDCGGGGGGGFTNLFYSEAM